jgi:cytochrome b561
MKSTSTTRSTSETWGSVTRALHWLSAIVIIGLLTHGWWMTHLAVRGPGRQWHYSTHALIAIYFALLLALRIVWRLGDKTPRAPASSQRWEVGASHAAHLALYLLLIAMVVTGYLMWSSLPNRVDPARAAMWDLSWFGFIKVPTLHAVPTRDVTKYWESWHELISHFLQALVVLHIAAAFWHRYYKRDTVLQRMTSGGV